MVLGVGRQLQAFVVGRAQAQALAAAVPAVGLSLQPSGGGREAKLSSFLVLGLTWELCCSLLAVLRKGHKERGRDKGEARTNNLPTKDARFYRNPVVVFFAF